MGTNALRPAAARKKLDLGATAFQAKVIDYEAPQPGKLSDVGKAVIYFEDEIDLYLTFRREKRDGTISADMSWLEYHERWKAKNNGTPLDKEKIKAHAEFRALKKSEKIAENVWFRDWYAGRRS